MRGILIEVLGEVLADMVASWGIDVEITTMILAWKTPWKDVTAREAWQAFESEILSQYDDGEEAERVSQSDHYHEILVAIATHYEEEKERFA